MDLRCRSGGRGGGAPGKNGSAGGGGEIFAGNAVPFAAVLCIME